MKNKKMITLVLSLILAIIIGAFLHISDREAKTVYVRADFAYDVADPLQDGGFADFVFVAKVKAVEDTVYSAGIPNTIYALDVIENLKGDLKTDVAIQFTKWGGLSADKSTISLLKGDQLLAADQYYLLLASAQQDGSLRQTGPYSAHLLDVNSKQDIQSNALVKSYQKYVADQIVFDRVRYTSKYQQ